MVPVRTARVLAIILTLFAGPACATDGPNASSGADSVKAGSWGGAHIAMTVGGDRTDVEFDCAKASVSGAIAIDRDGAFSATGTLQTEGPGPTRPDGPPPRPMRLSGTVKGDDMQVHVVLTDQNEDAGTFTLTFGAAPRLTKCR
jgi:hypothetical protein